MGKASRNKKDRVKAPPTPGASPSGTGGGGGRPRWLLPAAGLVVVILATAAILAFALGGSSGSSLDQTMKAAGCSLRTVKPVPPQKDPTNYHADVPTVKTVPKWSTDPPSAGAHYGLWAVWDFYHQAVPPQMVVHNEEHGGMIMWWGDKVSGQDIDAMNAFYNESPEGMLGTPYARLGDKIALTAWTGDPAHYYKNGDYGVGHIALCSSFDHKAFTAFRDAFRGHGPEGIPLSQDTPGTGPNG